jgi:hypothetical protein
MVTFILLSIITCGIYPLVVTSRISEEINLMASPHDGRNTMHYCLLFFLIAPITMGIATFVWYHNISERIGNELKRRGIDYNFGASDYWLWNILGSWIVIGPFVYLHKMLTAMNKLNAHYNMYG